MFLAYGDLGNVVDDAIDDDLRNKGRPSLVCLCVRPGRLGQLGARTRDNTVMCEGLEACFRLFFLYAFVNKSV